MHGITPLQRSHLRKGSESRSCWGNTLILDFSPPGLCRGKGPIVVLNIAINLTSLCLAAQGKEALEPEFSQIER